MPLIDTGYKRWDGRHRGIWYRRFVIASAGLRACLASQWTKRFVGLAWMACLAQIAILFFVGQLLVPDSIVVTFLGNLGPALQSLGRGLMTWLVEHPEVSVHTVYNLLFYFFSTVLSTISFIAVALALPHLITLDLSSRAILVYSSKAVNRFDYLLGKFGVIFGLLTLTWLGPIVVAWVMGNTLAPNWNFFWHSRIALLNTLQYVGVSMIILSVLGLGVSATSSKEKSVAGIWFIIWILGNAFVPIGFQTKAWLKHLSFSYNFDQIALASFRLRQDIEVARESIPVINQMLPRPMRRGDVMFMQDAELVGAAIGLGIMVVIALIVLRKQVKPE